MKVKITSPEFKKALALITVLFFMWGLSYGLVDVLNKHFQEVLGVTKAQSGLIQFAYFGAYFVVAIPAGLFMNRFGYKAGIIMGLLFFASGAFLTIPAAGAKSFHFFLFSFFILAMGLGTLETAANPYATVLGPKESSATRLNLAQCFNGLGQFIGPIIGGLMFFSVAASDAASPSALASVKTTYVGIGILVLIIALLFAKTKLPDIREKSGESAEGGASLLGHKEFLYGVMALFFYVAAQVGLGAFFINLTVECLPGATSKMAAFLLSIGMICFLGGRFVGTALLTKIAPQKAVLIYGSACAVLSAVVILAIPYVSVVALIAAFFFMSIMFPTIFALAVRHLGSKTKIGSSCLIMAIVGGALMPTAMGRVADISHISLAFSLPLVCFLIAASYGLFYNRLCRNKAVLMSRDSS
ncbi:MAG: L-fucose:H+ symporter permease [Deltaproteobacteria bacterium]|nr:L-fucose:H+ symporter permease [Deltaproteobacteria bacterium]